MGRARDRGVRAGTKATCCSLGLKRMCCFLALDRDLRDRAQCGCNVGCTLHVKLVSMLGVSQDQDFSYTPELFLLSLLCQLCE